MILASWNVNGIRAVEKKLELQKFIKDIQPDVLFMQETKAQREQLSAYLTENQNYHQSYYSAEKKGYSGVSVWISKKYKSRVPKIITGMKGWNDTEGRIIRTDIAKNTFLGIYFPNGGKSPEAWNDKIKFFNYLLNHINQLRDEGRKVIVTGDFNVAHNEIDLARPKENKKSIGFLPEERAWVDELINHKWIDVFRYLHPNEVSYTWWNMRTRARDRNVGWRLDYFVADKFFLKKINKIEHLTLQMGSDHCPIILDINI